MSRIGLGLAFGLWFSPEDRLTLDPFSVRSALAVLDPIPDAGPDLSDMVNRIATGRAPGGLTGMWSEDAAASMTVSGRIAFRPVEERAALVKLAALIDPGPY
jgi:hypothetical protein